MSHHKDTYWVFSMNWFESYKKSPIKESIYYHKVMWPFEFSRSKQWQFSQRMVSLSKELAHFKKHGAVIFWELTPSVVLTPSAVPSLWAWYHHSQRGTITPSVVPSLPAWYHHSQRGSTTLGVRSNLFPLKEEWVPVLWEMVSFGECLIYRNRQGNCRWASLLTSSPVYQILAIQQKLTLRRLPKYTKGTI